MPKNFKKNYVSGHGEQDPDIHEFLQKDISPWDHTSASGTYQARRFDDDTGHRRGANWDDTDTHGLVQKLPDERVDYAHEGLAPLIDDSQPYNKLLAGGSKLTKGKGIGSDKPPRPNTGPRTNARG